MPDVHLANAPRHVCEWPGHIQASIHAVTVDRVNVVNPDRHPDALIGRRIAIGTKGCLHTAIPATTLRTLAEEDLELAGADGPEGRGLSPLKPLRPAELLEPGDTFREARDVQNRRHGLGDHGRPPVIRLPTVRTCRGQGCR